MPCAAAGSNGSDAVSTGTEGMRLLRAARLPRPPRTRGPSEFPPPPPTRDPRRPATRNHGLASISRSTNETVSPASARPTSGPDQVQNLVALLLHVVRGHERLEVQAQERLRVGRAHVEVPVLVVDRHAVEPADLGVGVVLGELLH